MTPTVGRIVHYKLSTSDVALISQQRQATQASGVLQGNYPGIGNVLPMIVTQVWGGGMVNGQVFLDGPDSLWVTSRVEGDNDGQWSWPQR